jgi:membrane-associated protease RseP (regulator of RpoE activity)
MSVLAAIAVLAFLILIHELGHFLAARTQGIRVVRFSIGFGPVLWKYQGPETEYAIRAIPLGGYVAFPDDEQDVTLSKDDPGLMNNRPILDRAIVISAGVIANLILAYVLLLVQLGWSGIPQFQPQAGVAIVQVAPDVSAIAVQAGIQPGDVVTAIDSQPLGTGTPAVELLQNAIKSNPDRALNLQVRRATDSLTLTITPKAGEDGVAKIGVQLAPNGTVAYRRATSPIDLINKTGAEFERIVRLTAQGFGQLIFNFREAANQVSGPVAIVAMGADIARSDFGKLLQFAALISVNLAIINILPLPALDGGQLAFLAIEGLLGKPLPMAVQQSVMQTGLVLLLGLGMFLIVRDTTHLDWVQTLLQQ